MGCTFSKRSSPKHKIAREPVNKMKKTQPVTPIVETKVETLKAEPELEIKK
jgi:predicted small metal-binding protein